ncbi:MAG: prepilin-type N-terminal cleavage/methylation domain-containing protein [Butyrivibrio sp.]|nr:prepilin-type N-terminal cleavage/methylation domain-containing protein [Butyrivibrio sp.]
MRKTQNSKGFSLVEILVTIMIIAIVSIPIIRSFVVTANVNHKARRLQNATDVAQNISEYFAARPMSELLADFGQDPGCLSPDKSMYVFRNIKNGDKDYYEGAEGEKFYVSVVMDSQGYESYEVPELKNLFGSGGVSCFKEISMYDQAALNYLIEKYHYPDDSTAQSLGLKKTTDIYVDTCIDGSYKYSVEVKYTDSAGNPSYETGRIKLEEVKSGSADVATERFPNLYIMYQPYGVYGNGVYSKFVDDVVNINFTQTYEDGSDVPSTDGSALMTNIYLVQQEARFQDNASKEPVYLDTEKNCHISYNGHNYDRNNDKHLTFYSEGNNEITKGDGTAVSLYTVKVYIRYDEADNTDYSDYYNHVNGNSDVFVSVSTIREE